MSHHDIREFSVDEGKRPVATATKTATTSTKRSTFFSDDKGNLRFVNLVVRHPCKIFFLILLANLGITFLLFRVVFQAGNPFTDPGSQSDPSDVRSIAYDSLRLAQEQVSVERALLELADAGPEARMQEENQDITYWVYEGETEGGVFGSVESIRDMKESLDLYLQHPDYESYCWRQYTTVVEDDNTTVTTSTCRRPLSSLDLYYASSWDAELAQTIMDLLEVPGNVERYNTLSLCVEFNLLCEFISATDYTDEDLEWVREMNDNITILSDAWDGQGDLQEDNLEQVTSFAAHMMQLNTKRGLVDFGFDKNFNLTNPVSMFSRAIVLWGRPLSDEIRANATDDDDETATDDEEDTGPFGSPDQKALTKYVLTLVFLVYPLVSHILSVAGTFWITSLTK